MHCHRTAVRFGQCWLDIDVQVSSRYPWPTLVEDSPATSLRLDGLNSFLLKLLFYNHDFLLRIHLHVSSLRDEVGLGPLCKHCRQFRLSVLRRVLRDLRRVRLSIDFNQASA